MGLGYNPKPTLPLTLTLNLKPYITHNPYANPNHNHKILHYTNPNTNPNPNNPTLTLKT